MDRKSSALGSKDHQNKYKYKNRGPNGQIWEARDLMMNLFSNRIIPLFCCIVTFHIFLHYVNVLANG